MIGTDIIEIDRIKKAAKNPAFLPRIFTPSEIEYIKSKNNAPNTIAGLFAAKEAVIKALDGAVTFKDISISHSTSGKPKASTKCGQNLHLSISHCKAYATAVAMIVES